MITNWRIRRWFCGCVGLLVVGSRLAVAATAVESEAEDLTASDASVQAVIHAVLEEESSEKHWVDRFRVLVDDLRAQQVVFDEDEAFTLVAGRLLEWIDPDGGELTEERADRIRRHRQGRVYDPGLGLAISNEFLRIGEFREDTPAETREWLMEGQRVVQIDGRDVHRTGLYQAHQMLRSEDPDPLQLVVENAENRRITQTVARVATEVPDVEWVDVFPFAMGYIKINRLRESTGQRVADIVSGWSEENLYGILLDLRGADGDDLASVQLIAGLFVDQQTFLFAYRDHDDQDLMVMEATAGRLLGKPVMVLIDGGTGGAAEVLAAVLEDSVRGTMLFGQPTRGDLLLRSRVPLSGGTELYLPTRRLVTRGGTVYSGDQGVRPDVRTAEADGAFRAARSGRTARIEEEVAQEQLYHRIRGDATLRRAVDVLVGLKALDIRPHGALSSPSR